MASLDFFDRIVNDGIGLDLDAFLFCQSGGLGTGADVEADDDGIGGGSQQYVAFGDRADGFMYDADGNFFRGKFLQRVAEGFNGSIHVTFDDQVKFLKVAQRETAADLIEGDMLLGADALFAEDLASSVGYFLCFAFIRIYLEFFTGLRRTVESQQQYGGGGRRVFDPFVPFIEHGLYAAEILTGNDQVAVAQRAALDQDGSHIAPAFIEGGFDDAAGGFAVGIGFQVEQFGFQQDLFQQEVDIQSFFGGDFLGLEFSTPVFHEDIHTRQLFLDLFGVGAVLIDFIDRKDHGQARCLGMGDGFFCLRHHRIVGGNHDNRNVGGFGTTGTHGRKCFVTRGIEEGDLFPGAVVTW